MAYASKYYDPVKAHEYYMKNRELKGYEDRYGGSRGNGTSAASNGGHPIISEKQAAKQRQSATNSHNQKIQNEINENRRNTQAEINENRRNTQASIQMLRDELNSMSKEDRKANRALIQQQIAALRQISRDEISALRQNNNDKIQELRMQKKGGSTAGFNEKGKEAAAYIKNQMEQERDEVIKKTNKDTDREMLNSVRRLAKDIEAMRNSGRGFSHKQFAAKIKAMLGQTKKKKIKAKRKHMSDYKQRYKDEIDKLRQDSSMYTYYDKYPIRVVG